MQAALDEEPGLDEAAVTKALKKYAGDDPPDLVYDNGAGLVKWLSDEGIKAPSRVESREEKKEKQKERWKTAENEQTGGGQQVGVSHPPHRRDPHGSRQSQEPGERQPDVCEMSAGDDRLAAV